MDSPRLLSIWSPQLLAFTTTGFAIKNFQGIFLDVNPAFCALTGYTRDELVGQHHSLVTHPDDIPQTDVVLQRFARGEWVNHSWRKRYVTKSGQVVHCRKKLTSLDPSDPEGKLILQIEDTSEEDRWKRESEESQRLVHENHERLAITLRSIGDGVIGTDAEGRVDFMNPVAEGLIGYSLAQAQGRPLAEVFHIIHETTLEPATNPVDEVLTTGAIVELQKNVQLILPTGEVRSIADSAAPIRSSGGETLGVVMVFRDTTDQQKLMAHVQRTVRLESLGVLAGGIAHDFNNLLSGLFTNFELLGATIAPASPSQVYLSRIVSSFDRARALTRQLLTFAKGGVPLRTAGRLSKELREGVEFVLSGSSIDADYDLASDLSLCEYDSNMISQVINNLSINAVQAMPNGGTIHVKASNVVLGPKNDGHLAPGPYVEVVIRDHGEGIPPEVLPRIFDPFFTTKSSGVGLGLATSHSILAKHDGTITVESEPGVGTTFRFYLPVLGTPSAAPPVPRAEFSPGGSILIVDDDVEVRESLGEMVLQLGFDPTLVADGQAALALLGPSPTEPRFRAIFMDLTIKGGLGGKQTVRRLREAGLTTPVVVVSGYSDDPVIVSPQDYGFTDGITKPFLRAHLVAVLARVLKPGP